MKKSPLAIVKERYGDDRKAAKAKLVAEVKALADQDLWIDRSNEEKGLEHASNAKLLHLHEVLTAVKAKFGNRAGLIDGILELEKRSKDAGYRSRLEGQPTPRLWDHYRSSAKSAAN